MKSPLSYYGGKAKMLKHIMPLIPSHKIYIEPFLGGGSVFWAKGPSFQEVLNDTNDNVINFYDILMNEPSALATMVGQTLYSETMHSKAYYIYQNPYWFNPIERAWAIWMITNFSFANKIGGGWKFDTGSDGSHIGVTFARKQIEMRQMVFTKRLESVILSNRDANQVLSTWNLLDVFAYLDPPYPESDQGHYKGYTIDMLMETVELLKKYKGKFMLSNYAHPKLIKVAKKQGWTIESFGMRLSVKVGEWRKTEVLIMNYQPLNKMF